MPTVDTLVAAGPATAYPSPAAGASADPARHGADPAAMSGDRRVRLWARIADQSLGSPVLPSHVCAAAVTAVGVDGAGLTVVVSPTVRETVNATNAVAADLEELQLTLWVPVRWLCSRCRCTSARSASAS